MSRDVTPEYLERVANWISKSGEVLVVLRYLRAAGAKDFALCRSRQEFAAVVDYVSIGTDIEVFKEPQLPLRGPVTEGFIERAVRMLQDGQEYLLISEETIPSCRISQLSRMGDSLHDLREDLQERMGRMVSLGICPDSCAADHVGLISASKGGIDGPR
jgi:hypothetical protein